MQSPTIPDLEVRLESTVRNASVPALYERALRTNAGMLAQGGSLVVSTGTHTGRSPKDRFIVERPVIRDSIDWSPINQSISASAFERLRDATVDYLSERFCYVQDLAAGADPHYQLPLRVITPSAWHALFAETMFIRPPAQDQAFPKTPFTILHAPELQLDAETFGLRSSTFIVVDFEDATILIGGTEYAGEIKKSIFSVMNFLLPQQDVLPMHCSCNAGKDGDVALFFGLSGTGKTTLSADSNRELIGDDEHGWSERGIFNFEGGCYAKVIDLREDKEPEIYATTRMFGTILENVVIDPVTREIDFKDSRLTENTRAVYPLGSIPNASPSGVAGHPTNVIMLTADAFGVLPPVARLSTDQALYYFLSGYTSKVAGTEIGIDEPEATFSAGFGAPFLPRRPAEYASLLEERLRTHGTQAWLVNTGWTGGPYGTGERMPIAATRAIVSAILDGGLQDVGWAKESAFGLSIPEACPGVPPELLTPRATWADPDAYDARARRLAGMFAENFQQFATEVSPAVAAAGPRAG